MNQTRKTKAKNNDNEEIAADTKTLTRVSQSISQAGHKLVDSNESW
jgi:hypothetical protein